MYNLLIAFGVSVLVFAGLYVPGVLKLGESLVPAFVIFPVVYFVLARRTFKQLERLLLGAQEPLSKQKWDQALELLASGHRLAPWQLGVRSQVEAQMGIIKYLRKDFDGAIPHLEKGLGLGQWLAAAMLGVARYKKKDQKGMQEAFEIAVRKGKKQGLVWNLYAYCLWKGGKEAEAMAVLARGQQKAKEDKRLQENLLALQNQKRMKMKGYAEQWYMFHLEAPPPQYIGGQRPFSAKRRR